MSPSPSLDGMAIARRTAWLANTTFSSFKELTKAIGAFVPKATLPLPDDLVQIIEGYLQKNGTLDESVADKLNDELISIYQKEVAATPGLHAPFINILRRLVPVLEHPARMLVWWDLLMPVQQHLNQEKDLAVEMQGIVIDILTADVSSDAETVAGGMAISLAEKIMSMWLEDCGLLGKVVSTIETFREKQLRETLIIYGKKRPRDFMTMLNRFMVSKRRRARTLHLMSDFIRNRPPHLYQVLQTPLFGSLINCLQLDTSTTVVSCALTVLTMVLPHMPSSLVPHLPTLFNIYARLLFWERELSSAGLEVESKAERRLSPNAAAWETMSYSPDFDDTAIPHLLNYFTILYGLYPINFMDYIRKPQRYIRHAVAVNSDDVEVQPTEIRHASEQFRQCHVVHENFYTLTIESEKTDFGRWIKSEPAEVVADCMALRLPTESDAGLMPSHFGMQDLPVLSIKDDGDKDGHESALLSSSFPVGSPAIGGAQGESWRNRQSIPIGSPTSSRVQSALHRQSSQSSRQSHRDSSSTRPSGRASDSPTLPAVGSYTQLQDMINSNKAIKSGFHQSLANDSVPSLALSHHESIPERAMSITQPNLPSMNTPASANENNNDAVLQHLYRQLLLMHNDLTFERFIKQQHLTHMGELRRRQVREAASEAETQNLIMANRHLKQRLEEAQKIEVQVKKDSEKSRTLAKKWEADLSGKLRAIREEQRKWHVEGETLRSGLDVAKNEAEILRTLLCEAEVRELGWKQKIQCVEAEANELERLRKDVERLTVAERNFQAQETERQVAITQSAEAASRAEMLKMQLAARDTESQQTHDLYQTQIVVLNTKLQEALKDGAERRADNMKAYLESTLAVSRREQAELKKRIADLNKKITAMNSTILELQSTVPTRSRSEAKPPGSPDLDISVLSSESSGSPLSFRNRQHRGFSDPEGFEATSYNATPPLDLYNIMGGQPQRPSTPSGAEGTSSTGGSTSPTAERYHGRGESSAQLCMIWILTMRDVGGVQNTIRKKDRKDDRDKDKKKSSGIRGIRGFV